MSPKDTLIVVRSPKKDVKLFAKKYPAIADWIAEATELVNNHGEAIKELLAHLVNLYHQTGVEVPEGVELTKLVALAIDTANLLERAPTKELKKNE